MTTDHAKQLSEEFKHTACHCSDCEAGFLEDKCLSLMDENERAGVSGESSRYQDFKAFWNDRSQHWPKHRMANIHEVAEFVWNAAREKMAGPFADELEPHPESMFAIKLAHWRKRAEMAEDENERLRGAAQSVIDSAVTDADTCSICLRDLSKHSSGCSIEALRLTLGRELEQARAVEAAPAKEKQI